MKYDILVFSPTGITSLKQNFPNFEQNETRIAVFGKTTLNSVKDNELIADIVVPSKTASSMSMALDQYIKGKQEKKVTS